MPIQTGDRVGALALAFGIMAALFMRERTGVGQVVDVSLYHTGVYVISADIGGTLVTGQDLQQVNRKDVLNSLANFYRTKDGKWLRLGIIQPDLYWSKFCQVIEREDLERDPRFETFQSKVENHDALRKILDEVFLSRTLDEWKPRLNKAELFWAPVQTLPEVVSDPQARVNAFFASYNHPTYGAMEVVTNPIKLNKTPEKITRPAPEFSQHTEEVLLEYGYTWQDIGQFKEQGVIA